ncbi:MAG: rhomboid family intramembrane serine protease [Cyanobacteriota bacterium]|nr:rhomboid family intramembrane serine protease [Cyanobacteriota bacterium]
MHEEEGPLRSQALANRLMDALGSEERLRGPLRDLASQPLLQQAIAGQEASRRAALASLSQQMIRIYAPAVVADLLDLLEAATGLPVQRPAATAPPNTAPASTPEQTPAPAANLSVRLKQRLHQHAPILLAIAPGLALAAAGALVFAWLAWELDRAVFEGWGWSGGVVLVVLLGLLQALSLGPLKALRQRWPLDREQALQPRQAWRWLGAAWIHERGLEACLNLVLLLIFLGDSALQLGDVVLRYSLTALATLTPAVLLATHWRLQRRWSGAAGPVSALIALAAGLSLLHWKQLALSTPLFSVPAWVLLLVYGALQLNWQLPSSEGEPSGTPLQRLICSQWAWGLLLGLAWAVITRLREQL